MLEIASAECTAILQALRDRHNVLISGAPGTGKSRLLEEVARSFARAPNGPVHVPGNSIAIPKEPPIVVSGVLPSPDRTDRRIYRTVFHQNSKYRDFLTGIVPVIGAGAAGGTTTFRITEGTLYRASEHARSENGAALLIIDEINRGPAVQIFGGSIVAMESAKRLGPDGEPHLETEYFELTRPSDGLAIEYAIPHHLYILGAMNQADTSVEPLDVAFLRRWAPFRLDPDAQLLDRFFGLTDSDRDPLPSSPSTPKHVYSAAVRAWESVNRRIALGRGREFQIGHGVLMGRPFDAAADLNTAIRLMSEAWRIIRAHVDEVFFGDVRGIAAVLGVDNSFGNVSKLKESPVHPYRLEDRLFADEPRLELFGPDPIPDGQLYALLRAVASNQ